MKGSSFVIGYGMKRVFTAILVFAAIGLTRTPSDVTYSRGYQIKIHNINRVEMCVSNYGKFGQNESGNAGCWWPKGSGQSYMFGAGVWFGTVDSATGDTLVTIGYGPHGGESEVAPGLSGMSPGDTLAIIYMYPDPWPAPWYYFPMAPQEHVSHQDSWCCFNDSDYVYHMPGDTRPIGVEVYQTVYPWDLPILEDVIFFLYEFKNVSGHNLYNCYIGIAMDNDIGDEAGGGNDIVSGIAGQWFVIGGDSIWVDNLGYQWQGEEEPGWDSFPGTIANDLLQTPFDLQYGQDKDNDGIPDQYERDSAYYWNNVPPSQWDADGDYVFDWRDGSENLQIGMTAFKRFTLDLEPNTDPERYLTLAGYNFVTGQYEPYDTVPSLPDDQRFLMASGPFDLPADSSAYFIFAIMFTRWQHETNARPDSDLALIDSDVQWWYDMYWCLYYGVTENDEDIGLPDEIKILPNPMRSTGAIRFNLTRQQAISIEMYDATGRFVRNIYQGVGSAGLNEIRLSRYGLAAGLYFVQVTTDDKKMVQRLTIIR